MEDSHQFWIVGASSHGEDRSETLLRRGYWELCGEGNSFNLDRVAQMKEGDRIAIKSLGGRLAGTMRIKAIGIIKEVDLGENRAYVEWIRPDVNRDVPVRGCLRAANGPFTVESHAEWLGLAFRL